MKNFKKGDQVIYQYDHWLNSRSFTVIEKSGVFLGEVKTATLYNKTEGKAFLDKSQWVVRPIELSVARALVTKYHYSKGATNTRVYTHGLFKKDEQFFDVHCLGVAWWLPPTKGAAIATYPEGDWRKVLSLTRLVVHPDVPKNGASFLMANSMKLIDNTKWECLVTYADTWQGHTGAIYKATNWEYMGETKPSPVFANEEGKMMGRKRGGKNLTVKELNELGFMNKGNHIKHKFRFVFKRVGVLKSNTSAHTSL